MTWEAVATILVVLTTTLALATNRVAADAALLAAAAALSFLHLASDRFPSPRDVAASLGNEGLVSIALLFVVAQALTLSGATQRIGSSLLGAPKSVPVAQARLMLPVTLVSAFLNNTTVVAIFLPVVREWAKVHRLPLSKLLIPLSYASILGGIVTLIGTSTNIVVQGLLVEHHMPAFGMFTLTPVALPVALVGIVYVMIASRYLLPDRRPAAESLASTREYTVELEVAADSPLHGVTISAAGLRHLPGLYLVEVRRGEDVEAAVGPSFVLRSGDRLLFVGAVQSVTDLLNMRGLVPAADPGALDLEAPRADRIFVEAVVSRSSPLLGTTIREGRFRTRHGAAILAVHRNGEVLQGKIGDIVLRAGDTLLVETTPAFVDAKRDDGEFFLVSRVKRAMPLRHDKAWISIAVLVLVVLGGALEPWTHAGILPFAFLGALLVVAARVIHMDEARRSIDWSVLFAVAGSLVVAKSLESTGAADVMATSLIGASSALGPLGALGALYVGTLLLTELVTNNAAAALAFPVAVSTASALSMPTTPFAIVICIAASCGFATPMGYQTHLMVYGPGGYRLGDFLKMGVGLDLVAGITTMLVLAWVYGLG